MLVNTPPMGWNSWNTFAEDISDAVVRETADKFIELGLDKAGYKYIVIDDCWSEKERDPKTHRIVASKTKFPEGMRSVADYVHSKGLKFGMYSCAGVRTCGDYPGSYDHEFLDAQTFAEFGVDFLKYDFCYKPSNADGPLLYRRMGNALRACGRDILFSACNWGSDDVWSWIRSTGAHMYRSTGDIVDNQESYAKISTSQIEKFCCSAPQCFNDMDMLTVGMFGKGFVGRGGCNLTQYKTQFGLWCLMGTPLMLGCDIRKIDGDILNLITNKELIAINQDPEVRQPFRCAYREPHEHVFALARLLADGDFAIGLFNMTDNRHGLAVCFDDLGFPFASGYDLSFREVISGKEEGIFNERIYRILEPGSCEIYRVTPVRRG